LIQDRLERALLEKVATLVDAHGIRKVCLGGGVALNCVANGKVTHLPGVDAVHVPFCPDDTGQSLGHAIYAEWRDNPEGVVRSANPFLGRRYRDEELLAAIHRHEDSFECERVSDPAGVAAELLAKGFDVSWFHGSSEFGPRALGARSLLANPSSLEARPRLNRLKGREPFRPFGVSVLEEWAQDYFDLISPSPYMSFAVEVIESVRDKIPSAVHVDGTCRIQTVSINSGTPLRGVLERFYALTGLPLVINTSFNGANNPIVETPDEAIQCMSDLNLKYGLLGMYLLRSKRTMA
jgi:carbamoyltransferase